MAEIQITVGGKAAEAIETIGRITGKLEPVDVIIAALRIYEWILAQQTSGATIIAEPPDRPEIEELELEYYIEDRHTAEAFFKERDVYAY